MKKFHLTHYKKIKLTKDISLRYFFAFYDKKYLVGKWVLKSHNTKIYNIVDEDTARMICQSHNKCIDKYKEIHGRYVEENGIPIYRKIIVSTKGKVKVIFEGNEKVISPLKDKAFTITEVKESN